MSRVNQLHRIRRAEGNAINAHPRDELFARLAAVSEVSDQLVQAKSETLETQKFGDERTHRVLPEEELVRPKYRTKYDSNKFRGRTQPLPHDGLKPPPP